MERDDASPVCTNGHYVSDYADKFRDGRLMGLNFKGHAEYWANDSVYTMLYRVGDDTIDQIRVHDTRGDTPQEHVRETAHQVGFWWHLKDWVKEG